MSSPKGNGFADTDLEAAKFFDAVEIGLKATSIIREAHNNLDTGNTELAKTKLLEAKTLGTEMGSTDGSSEIAQLESRIEWVENRPVVLAQSNNLVKADVDNIDPGAYAALVVQLEACLEHYTRYTGRLTADELSLKQKLESVLAQTKTKIEQQQLLQASWRKKSKATNKTYGELIAMNLAEVNLEVMKLQVIRCLDTYNAHQLQLSSTEIENRNTLDLLLEKVHAGLNTEKNKRQREKNRIKHVGYERDITKELNKLKANLRTNQLAQALVHMNEIVLLANFLVGHADDIIEKKYAERGYFDESLTILSEAEAKYRASRNEDPKIAAEGVIFAVLDRIAYAGNCEKSILPRHHKRLMDNLIAELKAQWFKFYEKTPEERKIVFDCIVDKILQDLIETTPLQRWTPFNDNWTNAAFCIKKQDDRSTKLVAEICEYLREYNPPSGYNFTLPIFLESEIFEPRSNKL